MIRFIKSFLIFVVLYHILVTIVGYGVLGGAYPQLPALGRDGLWLLFFVIVLISNFKDIKAYLTTWKWPRIAFISIMIFGIGISFMKGKSVYDIFIGIKYGLLYLYIFLSATFIGHIRSSKTPGIVTHESGIGNFLKFLKYLLITTLFVGFLRQGLKFIWPDFFLHIGYGPFNDFVFGNKPPIYYLTGYKGTSRRQGIFSGPNNYGYLLIAFFPAIIFLLKTKIEKIKTLFTNDKQTIINLSILLLWILAIGLTLSRTACIGGVVALTIVNIQRIKKNKKLSRGIGILLLAGIVGLSILKGASTLGHIKAKFGSIQYVIQQPSGYGLGTSGPAVNYHGTILPENYYIQLMLDIGTIGFILWTILIGLIIRLAKRIQETMRTKEKTEQERYIYLIRKGLNIGRVCLLVMGIFLHVFEDSMINYLFFISRGILTGYLSTYIKKRD
ncbi:MAG: hypothetical protein NTY80_03750 [candidate division SR1 bacterium]|nr:hypothetical protein [candidate division SR1 bacterium]